MDGKSLVSICVPTYNSARFLRQCLDSIAAQTYKNVEVLISDNASTDDTVSIINEYVQKHGFKLDVNPVNMGTAINCNKLIGMAKGAYVAVYHSDDVYESTIVEESVKIFDQDNAIGLVGTMGNVINDEGVAFNTMRLPKHLKKLNKTVYTFDEALSGILTRGWFFVTPSMMVRRNVFDKLGMFESQAYGSAGDYAYWLNIARKFKVAIIDKKLINYRVHKNQGTELELRKNPEIPSIVLVIRKFKELTTNKKLRRQCDACISSNIISAARRQNYYGLFEKSNTTLNALQTNNLIFSLHKYGIKLCNVFKLSIKKRTLPGHIIKS